jgi:pimeloyl-ACP methyl ester carboxylesterase
VDSWLGIVREAFGDIVVLCRKTHGRMLRHLIYPATLWTAIILVASLPSDTRAAPAIDGAAGGCAKSPVDSGAVTSTALLNSEEIFLSICAGDYPVIGILSLPEQQSAEPAVLLLHGTASQKNEVGNLYARLASALAKAGIASLRIDFAGSGDSPVDYRRYNLSSATTDALAAYRFLRQHPAIDPARVAVLGFSQGGLIAQRLVLQEPALAALATWSTVATDGVGAFQDFFDAHYATALRDGYAPVSFPWLEEPLKFDLQWFEDIKAQRTLTEMRGYEGPILTIAGAADTTVPFSQSSALIAQSGHPASRGVLLAGADHIFNVLSDPTIVTPTPASHEQLIALTVNWFTARFISEASN